MSGSHQAIFVKVTQFPFSLVSEFGKLYMLLKPENWYWLRMELRAWSQKQNIILKFKMFVELYSEIFSGKLTL